MILANLFGCPLASACDNPRQFAPESAGCCASSPDCHTLFERCLTFEPVLTPFLQDRWYGNPSTLTTMLATPFCHSRESLVVLLYVRPRASNDVRNSLFGAVPRITRNLTGMDSLNSASDRRSFHPASRFSHVFLPCSSRHTPLLPFSPSDLCLVEPPEASDIKLGSDSTSFNFFPYFVAGARKITPWG